MKDISFFYKSGDPESMKKVSAIFNSFSFRDFPKVPDLDCPRILVGDQEAILRAKLGGLQLKSSVRYISPPPASPCLDCHWQSVNELCYIVAYVSKTIIHGFPSIPTYCGKGLDNSGVQSHPHRPITSIAQTKIKSPSPYHGS